MTRRSRERTLGLGVGTPHGYLPRERPSRGSPSRGALRPTERENGHAPSIDLTPDGSGASQALQPCGLRRTRDGCSAPRVGRAGRRRDRAIARLGGELRRPRGQHGDEHWADHHRRRPGSQPWCRDHRRRKHHPHRGDACSRRAGAPGPERRDERRECAEQPGVHRDQRAVGRSDAYPGRLLLRLVGPVDGNAHAQWPGGLRLQVRQHAHDRH